MPVKREVAKQSWAGVLSPKHLSGQIIWILVIALVGILLAAGLNPAIFGSSDTKDSQVAATGEDFSPIDGQLTPLSIVITQMGLTVEASTPAYKGSVVWRYRFIAAGEVCELGLFKVAPNHPAVHDGNLLTIPSASDRQDFYRNAWVCFKASDQFGRQDYEVFNIDLGNPTVSIRREQSGGQDYLQAYSSEDPTSYRVISWESPGLGGAAGDVYPLAGTYCERVFIASSTMPQYLVLSDASVVDDGRVGLAESKGYCFEATDEEGNRTYVSASILPGVVYASQRGKALYATFSGTSGRLSWIAKGPSNSSVCDELTFQSADISDYISPQSLGLLPGNVEVGLSIGDEVVDGQYYCLRATDSFGYQAHKSFGIDLAAPELNFEVSEGGISSTVSVGDDADILNSWFIGPLTDTQISCEDSFDYVRAPSGLYIPRYSRTASFTSADSGKFYCFQVEDRAGNSAIGKYLIP